MKFKSKKQWDKDKPKYPLLPQDDYKLKIIGVKEEQAKKYQAEGMEDVLNITFGIVSFMDGKEAKDVDGGSIEERKLFFTGRKNDKTGEWSIGFMTDGTPSKLRALVAYATGQDAFDEVNIESWEKLLGKEVNAEVIQYVDKQGEKKNKIARFIPPRNRSSKEKKEGREGIKIIEDGREPEPKNDIPF